MKLLHKRYAKLRFLVVIVACYIFGHFSGVGDYLYQRNYHTEFSYPLDVNISRLIDQLENKSQPDIPPLNHYRYGLRMSNNHRCKVGVNAIGNRVGKVHLLLVIKSSVYNYNNRVAIRETWGREDRFDDYIVRRVFLLALPEHVHFQNLVETEQEQYQDLVQGNFIDQYYNNTCKAIMGFKWIRDHCPEAQFIMFVDDDFYISTKNVLRLLRNPVTYPEEDAESAADQEENLTTTVLSTQNWYTGFLFYVLPVRLKFHKFFISLDEYPFNIFPPFINAGAFLISKQTLHSFYYASLYTVPLKLDDVYIGILARKIGLQPQHNKYFFPYKVPCSFVTYKNLIASHGYRNPQELIQVWKQQVQYGNA